MNKELKQQKASINEMLAELDCLCHQILDAGEDGKRTMKQTEFEYYLNSYLKLFAACGDLIYHKAEVLKKYVEDEFIGITYKIHQELHRNLIRILYPLDNFYVHATSLDQLADAIATCEKHFTEDVEKAHSYFGDDFLNEKLYMESWHNPLPTCS